MLVGSDVCDTFEEYHTGEGRVKNTCRNTVTEAKLASIHDIARKTVLSSRQGYFPLELCPNQFKYQQALCPINSDISKPISGNKNKS